MTKRCPDCKRIVKDDDLKCSHCNTLIEKNNTKPESGSPINNILKEVNTVTPEDVLEQQITKLPDQSIRFINEIKERFNLKSTDIFPSHDIPRWLMQKEIESNSTWILEFFAQADAGLSNLWAQRGLLKDDPEWRLELIASRNAMIAKVFVLHGNINDCIFHQNRGYIQLRDFLFEEFGGSIRFYSLSQGFHQYKRDDGVHVVKDHQEESVSENLWQQIKADFNSMDTFIRGSGGNNGNILVINYVERLFPAGMSDIEREFLIEMIMRWAVDPLVPEKNLIILTTTNHDGLHPDIKSRVNKIHPIEMPRPDLTARIKYIAATLFSFQSNTKGSGRTNRIFKRLQFAPEFGQNQTEQIETLAAHTAGLNLMGIEDVILRAFAINDGHLDIKQVSGHKKNLLAGESAGLLDMIDPKYGFDSVGGLTGVHNRLIDVCNAIKSQDKYVRRTIPMGILFLGPPGTGKSLVAEALAKESGLTFVKLGNFRGMYVGQSEKNLSLALQLIRSLAPVVVFVDEIDQNIGKRGDASESGPEKRLFAKLLEFMSDTSLRGSVLWIGASNEPKNLDDAFKRAGRFDLKLPFFLPEPAERRSILGIKIKSESANLPNEINDSDLTFLAEKSGGFSGAEIELLVNEALRLAVRDINKAGKVCLTLDHFKEVLKNYHPDDAIAKYRETEEIIAKDIPYADLLPEHLQKNSAKSSPAKP